VTDTAGKTQILDAVAPVWKIKIAFEPMMGGQIYIAERAPQETFVTHFATCSKANQFSKKKEITPHA
jgi:hypothetical protein